MNSWTVEEFKAQNSDSPIKIKRSKQGKLYFTCGAVSGAVASKGIPQNPLVSLVEAPDSEKPFYLLHDEGGGEVLATF
nr:MAG TPA: hypothetical protein [Crassvirales sp.]